MLKKKFSAKRRGIDMNIHQQFDHVFRDEQPYVTNLTAYFKGESDAINGKDQLLGKHIDYDRGYNARSELEDVLKTVRQVEGKL
jgi:hypothetical protein